MALWRGWGQWPAPAAVPLWAVLGGLTTASSLVQISPPQGWAQSPDSRRSTPVCPAGPAVHNLSFFAQPIHPMATTPDDFEITYFDNLTVSQLTGLSGPADAPEVQEIQQEIDHLRSEIDELGGVDALEAQLASAEDDLEETEVQHELGQATSSDVASAEEAVEEARTQLRKARRKEQAIERLQEQKEAALEAALRALRDRVATLYEIVMDEVHEKMNGLLDDVEQAVNLLNQAGTGTDRARIMRGTDSDVRLYGNVDSVLDFLRAQLEERS